MDLVESGVECLSSALGGPRVVRRGEQDTTLGGRVGPLGPEEPSGQVWLPEQQREGHSQGQVRAKG